MTINWKYIIVFILIAFGLSFPVQQGYLDCFFHSITRGTFLFESTYLLAGFSTLTAAVITLAFHKNISKEITTFGNDKIKNLFILSLPVVAFSISGLNNDFGLDESLYGFALASINTIYAFTEEFGWRKYLQNALTGLNKYLKYILIGLIWWIWHFRFDTPFDIFIFPLICIGGGILLGKLADDTKSFLPVVAVHNIIILTTTSGEFGKNKIIAVGIIILGWVTIEQIWKRKKAYNDGS